jgi:hypothetical protein
VRLHYDRDRRVLRPFFAKSPVISPIWGWKLYFLEFPRSAVLFTRFVDGAVSPPSFEQF